MYMAQDDLPTTPKVSACLPIRTTLYDLIATIGEEIDPADDEIVTAATIRLLQTYRVTCVGDLSGVRLMCDVS